MPIEIRELVIRATVSLDDNGDAGQGAPWPGVAPLGGAALSPQDIEQIVQECVRQVMRVLARQQER